MGRSVVAVPDDDVQEESTRRFRCGAGRCVAASTHPRAARSHGPAHRAECTRRASTSRGWSSSRATSPSGGTPVVTAEVPDLLRYRITPALTDAIEDAAAWTADQPALASDGKVGVFGISFAGGLSIAAAGRPRVRDRVAYVLSFGGHGNLGRVVRYLCTGQQPDGAYRKPHDYGVVVALMQSDGAPRAARAGAAAARGHRQRSSPRRTSTWWTRSAARAEFDRARRRSNVPCRRRRRG